MVGYVRQDITDQISNGSTVDAVPLDSEFDAITAAFSAVSGHTHSGGVGGGSPITVVGPTQDIVASANSLTPKTDDTIDLGSNTYQWKDLYVNGVANIDSLVVDTADINAGTIDNAAIGATTPSTIVGTTISGTALAGPLTGNVTGNVTGNLTGNVTGNSTTATTLQTPRTISLSGGVTGSVSFNGSANVAIVSTVTNDSHSHTLSTITDAGTIASQNANNVTITGGNISGITDLAIVDGGTGASTAANARTNLGLGTIATQNSSAVSVTGGSITGITDLAIADGGTGASTAANARTNLGLGTAATTAATDYATAAQGVKADAALPASRVASQAEAEGGTENTKFMTSLNVSQAMAARSLNQVYVSSPIAVSIGALHTFTHGLGVTPTVVSFIYVCISAERGWAVGDEIHFNSGMSNYNEDTSPAVAVNSTQIKVYTGGSAIARTIGMDGSSRAALTPAKWNLKVVAYA